MTTQRPYLIVSPVGSEGRTVRVFRYYDGPDSTSWSHRLYAGCWDGTLGDDFHDAPSWIPEPPAWYVDAVAELRAVAEDHSRGRVAR